MNKKMSKRQKDIKSKLMAAICMLLVSSIMMVSSTYAWFTLSTAPEVTGIQTSVGANGNLEMALLPANGNADTITSSSGDSMATQAINLANVTWGNLVDLSYKTGENNFYGMDKITLFPSKLNVEAPATESTLAKMGAALLQTPAYGADGRVSGLENKTVTSTYDTAKQVFPQNNEYGVRAVGTASGMTDRQLAYRNAQGSASTAMSQAKTFASQSLNTNGATLANIALAHGVDAAATYKAADVDALKLIVSDLLGTTGTDAKTGVLQYIENAYRNYILAYGASTLSGLTDEQYKAFASVVNGADDVYAALADIAAAAGTIGQTITFPAELTTPLNALKATRTAVETAKGELDAITATEGIAWATLSTPLQRLANTDAIKINGYAASTIQQNMSAIINQVASQGLTVTMASQGGVYADIADHCGDYNAAIVIQKVEYGGLVLENMNARMQTDSSLDPNFYLVAMGTVVANKAPQSEGGQTMPISDMYGYIIDLAFRTNAAESNLLLQTAAKDRIYGQEGSEDTQGGGSTMTFTSTTTDFSVAQMKELMKAIRVVFFNPSTREIYTTAKLDMADNALTVVGGNTVTANLYLYKTTAAGTVTQYIEATYVSDGNEGWTEATTGATHAKKSDGTYVPATHIKDQTSGEYRVITDGETATHAMVETAVEAGEALLKEQTDAKIIAMPQNTAATVSVLVYLDGERVGNDDVAATDATSMTGTMNLQFSSSANLVPMEYTPLMKQDVAATETTAAPSQG